MKVVGVGVIVELTYQACTNGTNILGGRRSFVEADLLPDLLGHLGADFRVTGLSNGGGVAHANRQGQPGETHKGA